MVYSREKKVGYVRAETQKEALAKALEIGIVPETTHDVRPYIGRPTEDAMMSKEEFSNVLNKMIG